MPTRVAVFVDYMNCYRRAREAFTPGSRSHVDGQIDPLRLAELLCGEQELVTVVTRPLGCRAPSSPQEKGIDVHLVVDMVVMAMMRRCDVAVLVSEDDRPASGG